MDDDGKAGSEPSVQFVKAVGSQVTGRHKDKKVRIHEAMCDLQLAIDGSRTQLLQQEQIGLFQQSCAALARACSIFLRKTVLGDRGESKTRLLDDEITKHLGLRFNKLRRISPDRRPLAIERNIAGGSVQATKLDDNTLQPEAVCNMPITPLEFKISIEWPLPGTASWTETPTRNKPWEVKPEELFDARSNGRLNCNEWLGQQLIMFDNKGITLKDVIRTVVNHEGAHSINVSRLLQTENEINLKSNRNSPAKNPEQHILNNIKLFGIKYTHIIIIESALYLYDKLVDIGEIERPKGDIFRVKPCLCTDLSEDVFGNDTSWLAFDGGLMLSFGSTKQVIKHKIKAVG